MTTLLEIANDVLTGTGYQAVSTVVGNNQENPRRLLQLMQNEGKALAKYKDWSILLKRNVFTTQSSAASYALPDDFDRFIDNTHWQDQPLYGPISTQRWQADQSGLQTVTINESFQIAADGNRLRYFVRPIPTSSVEITFWYVTDTWCRANGGKRQNEWKADNDVLLLDDHVYRLGVEWRWLKARERPYAEEFNEYQRERDKAYARDGGMPQVPIADALDEFDGFAANIGETFFGQ